MLELTSGPCWSYSCLEFIVMFWRELIILGRGDLIWLASMGMDKASLFTSAFFRFSVGSPIVNACTKVMVGRATTMEVEDTTMAELLEQWTGAVLPLETLV
ncbi:hypothetical protein GW17_00053794 [Ensete ventricosum]|nr:hypothetical protein GW17_00053794 [Ensete ventricosum]